MTPIYQRSGMLRGQNGDCFQACLASVLNLSLDDVPNFFKGVENGKLLPESGREMMVTWLKGFGLAYAEFGFNISLSQVLQQMGEVMGDNLYLVTGRNTTYGTHVVVARKNKIIHDPATSPQHHTLIGPCHDGYVRVGLFLKAL